MLHHGRTKYAPDYLRRVARHFDAASAAALQEAARLYDEVKRRLGSWDASDPLFGMVKQQPLATWTQDVRRREIELLHDVHRLEQRAMTAVERALAGEQQGA